MKANDKKPKLIFYLPQLCRVETDESFGYDTSNSRSKLY